jgi:hypothetical protein
MQDFLAIAQFVIFTGFFGTFILAPFYFYVAKRSDGPRLVRMTLIVTLVLAGCTLGAVLAGGPGVSDSRGLKAGLAAMLFIFLTASWVGAALLYWSYFLLSRWTDNR